MSQEVSLRTEGLSGPNAPVERGLLPDTLVPGVVRPVHELLPVGDDVLDILSRVVDPPTRELAVPADISHSLLPRPRFYPRAKPISKGGWTFWRECPPLNPRFRPARRQAGEAQPVETVSPTKDPPRIGQRNVPRAAPISTGSVSDRPAPLAHPAPLAGSCDRRSRWIPWSLSAEAARGSMVAGSTVPPRK